MIWVKVANWSNFGDLCHTAPLIFLVYQSCVYWLVNKFLLSIVAVTSDARGRAVTRGNYFNKQRRNLTAHVAEPHSRKRAWRADDEQRPHHSTVSITISTFFSVKYSFITFFLPFSTEYQPLFSGG